jgi:hypothetical protein
MWQETELNLFRIIAASLLQLLTLLYLGGRFDFIFGFNRTDYGFTILLFLFVLVPLIAFTWLLAEIILSMRLAKRRKRPLSFLMPGVALLFFVESVFVTSSYYRTRECNMIS